MRIVATAVATSILTIWVNISVRKMNNVEAAAPHVYQ